jgi:phage terminase large subunit-like protein
MREVFADGIESCVMPTPAGNGKSTFGAAVAVAATFLGNGTGAPQVPIVATTLGQAVRSVYGPAASMVAHAPELNDRAIIFTGTATPRVFVPANEGLLFPISQDIPGIQGLDPSLAVIDELGFLDPEVWSSMLARIGKRSRSLLWGTGTPGLDRDNALWALRNAVEAGLQPESMAWREYAATPGCDLLDRAEWHRANPALDAGFMRESGLAAAIAQMPESHARVFRLGQWIDGVEGWLGADGRSIWDHLVDPYEWADKQDVWVGVDVGLKRDSTGVCWVGYRDDDPERLHSDWRMWVPSRDEPVDVTDVMAYIRTLADLYTVRAVSFDPRYMDVPAKMLADEGLPMVEVPQSLERMTPAIGDLYRIIRTGGLSHNGDPLVAQQVLNAIPRLNDRGFTLSKGKSRGRIDAAIALALAVERATHQTKKRAPLVIL